MARVLPKHLPNFATLVGLAVGVSLCWSLGVPQGLAQRCTVNCGSRQIQFTPGERIRIFVVNRTSSLVQVEQIYGTKPIALLPSQAVEVDPNFGTTPNASLVFWDETTLPIRAVLFRPEPNSLRIEILPGGRPPGDRSVYIENDGKVKVF